MGKWWDLKRGPSWRKCITGDMPVKDILALAAFCFSSLLPGHGEVSSFLLPHPAAMVFLPTISLKGASCPKLGPS